MTLKEKLLIAVIAVPLAIVFIFMAIKIGDEQRADDARRTGIPVEQLENRITRPAPLKVIILHDGGAKLSIDSTVTATPPHP